MSFASRLRQAREQTGLTQLELAENSASQKVPSATMKTVSAVPSGMSLCRFLMFSM